MRAIGGRFLPWSLAALLVGGVLGRADGQEKGPSSSASAYYLPTNGGRTTALLTVGDSVGGYSMVGIPDGLGAYDNGDGTFTVLMNHELGSTQGVARAHGTAGAFVSKWVINKSDLSVVSGQDLISTVNLYNIGTGTYDTYAGNLPASQAFTRLCSADLPAESAFYNANTNTGLNPTSARLFLDGEEGGQGRAFAHIVSGTNAGTSYELAAKGNVAWENVLASPFAQDKTILIGQNDTTPAAAGGGQWTGGQVLVYIGTKTNSGSEIDQAGLTNGSLYGVKVNGIASEARNAADNSAGKGTIVSGTTFTLHNFGDVKASNNLQPAASAAGVTAFLRPEDGAWDPDHPQDYYFVTTDRFDTVKDPLGSPANQIGMSRLYRLRFSDIENPEAGGTIDLILEGNGPQQMWDNIGFDQNGLLMLQEDPGNQPYGASIWAYDTLSGLLRKVMVSDPARFGSSAGGLLTAATPPFNQDEESSGIIDISRILGRPAWLFDVQAHYSLGGALVEGGQLLIYSVPEPGTMTLALVGGLAMWVGVRRRRTSL